MMPIARFQMPNGKIGRFEVPEGTITEEGIRKNINVSILYLASWLNGQGAAAIHHLMEDAATAEISRSQLWQWLQNKVTLDNGKVLTEKYYHRLAMEEFEKIRNLIGDKKLRVMYPHAFEVEKNLPDCSGDRYHGDLNGPM